MKRIAPLILGLVLCLAGAAEAKLLVAVSIPPQKYFAQRIGGEHVDVMVMVPAGAEAHTYEPKPRQLAELEKARLYFAVGMDFERSWLPRFKAANPKLEVVQTDAWIKKIPMVAHEDHDEDEAGHAGQAHHHEAGEPDPHVWLSPRLAKIQASAMREALHAADPEHARDYEANYEEFAAECDHLEADIKALFADLPPGEHKFMVFHPAWGYFAQDFGLTEIPIEQLGREPGPKALAGLIQEAKEEGVKVIFVQPQFGTRQAETVAQAIGGRVAMADDLAEDWADNLRTVAQALRQGLAGTAGAK